MFYVAMYLIAIVLANLTVAWFGPGMTIVNAFLFIGLDLTARDRLHDAWRGRQLLPKMAALIAAGSVLSWLLNRGAGQIALASFVAFAAAATVDAVVYQLLRKYPRWLRVNGSNVPSALVDSLVFPTLAFGSFLPAIVLGQFAAKTLGGFAWSLLFRWLDERAPRQAEQAPSS
ncbi:MAG: VUT family protein [Anaerolineales bacterium]|nr:VUT family protein [Anaerolineales bacterium]